MYGLGLAFAVSGSDVEVYHADRLGSVRAITDGSGSVTGTYRYDDWGNVTMRTGSSDQPFGFTGEPGDATGLTYVRARYYDPALGRFVTRDWYAGMVTEPGSLNSYSYALNNPTRFTDQSGLSPSSAALGCDLGKPSGLLDCGGGVACFDLTNPLSLIAKDCYREEQGKTGRSTEKPGACVIDAELAIVVPCNPTDERGNGKPGSLPGSSNRSAQSWYRSTFNTAWDSLLWHWAEYAEKLGKTLAEYTQDALDFLATRASGSGRDILLKDGTWGMEYFGPNGEYGVFTENGQIVTYHYPQ